MADVDNLGEGEKSMHFALHTSHFTHSSIEMCPLIGRADGLTPLCSGIVRLAHFRNCVVASVRFFCYGEDKTKN